MTTTLTRTSQVVEEWCKIFPVQATETYTGSVTFMKQLTVVALSTITYLQDAFPEDNYTVDQFGGLKIRILKTKCEDDLAQFLISALSQAFEALEKRYLHQIALCFYEGGEGGEEGGDERLLEYHVFEYSYAEEGAGGSVRVVSGGAGGGGGGERTQRLHDAARDTLQLLRACMVMLGESRLPERYDVSLQLYYTDAAPEGYQAPGYRAAARDPLAARRRAALALGLGRVRTRFHALSLRTFHRDMAAPGPRDRRDSADTADVSHEALASSQSSRPAVDTPADGEECGTQSSKGRISEGDRMEALAGEEEGSVRCECGLDDAEPPLLTCRWCGRVQHAACYGWLSAAGAGAAGAGAAGAGAAPHCCARCYAQSPGSRPAPDAHLLRTTNRACYAVFRRALAWLRALCGGGGGAEPRVSAAALSARLRLSAPSGARLLAVLHAQRLLRSAHALRDPEASAVVDAERLEAVLREYFREGGAGLPERLAADCGGAAGGAGGAGQLLAPLQRVQIEPDEDMLQQYRAALPEERETDELPLSGSHNPVEDIRAAPRRKRPAPTPARRSGVRTKRANTSR